MDLTLTDWLLITGFGLALFTAIAKYTPWGWDDKLAAILTKALGVARANKGIIERITKRKPKNKG